MLSLLLHYVVKSKTYVLIYCCGVMRGTLNGLVSDTYGISGRDLFISYGIQTDVYIEPKHV